MDNFEIEMQPTSVIVGENRVGKSNLLEALRLVLDPSLPDSHRQLRAEDFSDHLDAPFAGNIIEIKVFLRGFDGNTGAKSVLADSIVGTDPLTAALTYQYRPRKRITDQATPRETDYEFVVFGGNDEATKVAAEVRKWLAIMVLPALRDAETDLQTWRKSPLRPLLERVRKEIPGVKLEDVRDKLDDATDTLITEPSMRALVNAINEQVRALAGPMHNVKTLFDFASGDPEQLLRSIRLYIDEAQARPVADVSLGTSNILFLSMLLQELEQRQLAKEVANSILAIEEPEAHLHPQLQRQIFRNFLRRSHSVIVTTHSPSLASVAPIASLVLLRRVGNTTKAFTPARLELSVPETSDLQRYLDVTRAEILFAKAVILVEGAAEQFLVPAFAARYLENQGKATALDDFGIAVCSVTGTDFAPYCKLLSPLGLSIPHVILTDGDPWDQNGKKTFAGLTRGLRLVQDNGIRTKIAQLVTDEQFEEAKTELEKQEIFVGDTTLEIELLPEFQDEVKNAFSELNSSPISRTRFATSVKSAIEGNPEAAGDVIRRIEAIGKGRFAQRLAEKVGARQPPRYLQHAIETIVQLVEESHARSESRVPTTK